MATISDTPMWVEGTLSAGNIRAGRALIECTDPNRSVDGGGVVIPNVWQVTVSVPGMSGVGNVRAFATPHTTVPSGTKATDTNTVQQVSVSGQTTSSFVIRLYRTSSPVVNTWIFWFAVRDAA